MEASLSLLHRAERVGSPGAFGGLTGAIVRGATRAVYAAGPDRTVAHRVYGPTVKKVPKGNTLCLWLSVPFCLPVPVCYYVRPSLSV